MKRRPRRPRRAVDGAEDSVWISFSDLLTALVAVFMLAAVALVFSLTQEQDALAQARQDIEEATAAAAEARARSDRFDAVLHSLGTGEQARVEMVAEVRDALAARGIEVEVDQASAVVHVPVDLLGFESGSSDIRPEHAPAALAIGEVVAEVLLREERYQLLDTVFIEGHTDDVPMAGLHGGNWGLSANRAISLWRLWDDRLTTDVGGMTGFTGERLFSVSGYAETRPVSVAQTTDDERAANRRIDIRFTEHRLSQEEIRDVRAATDQAAAP